MTVNLTDPANQLTDKRSQLRTTAQNYQIALAWYQSNIDSPAALQAWDAATAEFMAAIGNRETDIIADLFDEIAELQEHRKAVIPAGWKLVPIEPTESMIVDGFESEPDEGFSDEKVWAEYEAMSGCQQAAHRAKLCWAAMLSAAPTAPEQENI
ncbi:hypothetical protein U0868_20935 [Kluyvera ascorbata]|uniref:hypothetical protein n=1 Tax=Kluyvera ascorbata TaxID=51288 RepID=UPI002AB8422C|nr:hypothetical protein [Kluyvera ascorbata]MDZ4034020.1 hypothetical protein [Kluyvera ascorbata]